MSENSELFHQFPEAKADLFKLYVVSEQKHSLYS